jgi:integrase
MPSRGQLASGRGNLRLERTLRIAKRSQDQARTADWPDTCICGERHALVFTTRTGRPVEPRNINRVFDVRCVRYGVRRITLYDTRRTCGSLLAALDVHPRIAMAILRHSRIALTMEIYTPGSRQGDQGRTPAAERLARP